VSCKVEQLLSPNNFIVLIDHFMENLIEDFTLAKKKKNQFPFGFKIPI
jgi:hypothetical protein